MGIVRNLIASLVFLCAASESYSQVSDLPENELGGRFQEDATGSVWLDVSNFYDQSYLEISRVLVGSGFRIARVHETGRLLNSLSGPGAPMGNPYVADDSIMPPASAFIGVYNDLDQNPNVGRASYRGYLQGPKDNFLPSSMSPEAASPILGAWVIQETAPSCDNDQELDFDCDGIDDKVIWREGNGTWFIRLSATSDAILQQWGLPGDTPIAGDFDGDGVPDLAVWRPTNGTWYIKNSSTQYSVSSATIKQFGLPGDIPMRLDTDSDGKLDLVVWRPSQGNFYTLRSSDAQILVEQLGLPGDIPVTAGRPGS